MGNEHSAEALKPKVTSDMPSDNGEGKSLEQACPGVDPSLLRERLLAISQEKENESLD